MPGRARSEARRLDGRRALAAAMAVAGLIALAGVAAQTRSDYFAAADTDHDGRLSLAEFQDWMSYAFRRLDRNGDQVLDPDEQAVPGAGRLTLDELHARQAGQFRRQDKNGDGYLSAAEFLAPPG